MAQNKLQAIVDANSLLRFAKQNADIALKYEPIPMNSFSELRLVTMFDAAHGVRPDGTSQGGFLTMLVHQNAFAEELPYHIIDWKSFKLPRVARSSLSAEAQSAGQAADSTEYCCRFLESILHPGRSLREILHSTTILKPVLITDAKALYDSHHKEGCSTSTSIDRRTSLEIRVMKEQLMSLQGEFRWISSECQFADGLTKNQTRSLLADRLRHGRIKFVYDPDYVAAKRRQHKIEKQAGWSF